MIITSATHTKYDRCTMPLYTIIFLISWKSSNQIETLYYSKQFQGSIIFGILFALSVVQYRSYTIPLFHDRTRQMLLRSTLCLLKSYATSFTGGVINFSPLDTSTWNPYPLCDKLSHKIVQRVCGFQMGLQPAENCDLFENHSQLFGRYFLPLPKGMHRFQIRIVYIIIITKLAGLFTSWIDIEKHMRSWTQHKCSKCSAGACHTRGWYVRICARMWVGLPLLADKETPHHSCLFSDDQSIFKLNLPQKMYDFVKF